MKYYTDLSGNYLGGFDVAPLNAVEVPNAPENALDTFVAGNWVVNPARLLLESRKAVDSTETLDIKNDAAIIALLDQTKVQWVAWAKTNFPTLTAAEATKLGINNWVLSMCARKALRP